MREESLRLLENLPVPPSPFGTQQEPRAATQGCGCAVQPLSGSLEESTCGTMTETSALPSASTGAARGVLLLNRSRLQESNAGGSESGRALTGSSSSPPPTNAAVLVPWLPTSYRRNLSNKRGKKKAQCPHCHLSLE